jgi:hypothetical protein
MNEFYEVATIVLGCIVVLQYIRIRKRDAHTHRLSFTLHQIAERKWTVETETGGFVVLDDGGDRIMTMKVNSKE